MVIPGLQKKGGAKKQRLGKKSGARSKSAPTTNFITVEKGFDYTQFNNIFVDVQKLQQAMVAFYRLHAEQQVNLRVYLLNTLILTTCL